MNGVVFHTSAMTMANLAAHGSPVHSSGLIPTMPSSLLAMPSKAKMKNHSLAVTAVGMAHGMRMAARTRPRPLNVAVHDHREPHAEHDLDDDADDGEEQGHPQGVVELRAEGARRAVDLAALLEQPVRVVGQPGAAALDEQPVAGSSPASFWKDS